MCVSIGRSALPTRAAAFREFYLVGRDIGFCFVCIMVSFAYLTQIGDCHGIANPDDSNSEERLPLQHGADSGRQILRTVSGPLSATRMELVVCFFRVSFCPGNAE